MTFVARKAGVVSGMYANIQPGIAEEFLPDDDVEVISFHQRLLEMKYGTEAEKSRLAEIKASTYVTDWDANIKGKTFAEIKTLYDGATQAQKSDLLLYLLLVRALEVKD